MFHSTEMNATQLQTLNITSNEFGSQFYTELKRDKHVHKNICIDGRVCDILICKVQKGRNCTYHVNVDYNEPRKPKTNTTIDVDDDIEVCVANTSPVYGILRRITETNKGTEINPRIVFVHEILCDNGTTIFVDSNKRCGSEIRLQKPSAAKRRVVYKISDTNADFIYEQLKSLRWVYCLREFKAV